MLVGRILKHKESGELYQVDEWVPYTDGGPLYDLSPMNGGFNGGIVHVDVVEEAFEIIDPPPQVNLKQLFMELGNVLVMQHHYVPASVACELSESDVWTEYAGETSMLQMITCWLNDPTRPELRDELEKMGVIWPMVQQTPDI